LLQFHYHSLINTTVVIKTCYWVLNKTAVSFIFRYYDLTITPVAVKTCY